jgi:YfiH family protein
VYGLSQVHSRDVFSLGDPDNADSPLPAPADFAREGDGMVSFSGGIFLAVTVADCLPVFLLDTEKGFFAALHSGWKGTGIVLRALEMMRRGGSRPEAIAAVLGPCIQGCCYRVDEERAKHFEAEFGPASPHVKKDDVSDDVSTDAFTGEYPLGEVIRSDTALPPESGTNWYIKLQAANARLLAAGGVRHIAYCTDCTFTDTRLGSFRREGAESYTRMIAMVGRL